MKPNILFTSKTYSLPYKSGSYNSIIRSNRPGLISAGSKISFLFVAAITITLKK